MEMVYLSIIFFTALQFVRKLVEYCAFSFSHKYYYNVIVVAIVKLLCRLKAKKALLLVFGAMKSLYCGIVREVHSVEITEIYYHTFLIEDWESNVLTKEVFKG